MEGAAPTDRPFVGRLDLLDQLRRRIDSVRNGQGGLTLLEGEVGTGKTTLARVLVDECRLRGLDVLVGRSSPTDNPPPFDLVRQALGAEESDLLPGSPDLTSAGLVFAPVAPTDAMMIGFAPRADDPLPGESRPIEERMLETLGGPQESSEGGRRRLIGNFTEDLLYRARRRPTALILEDLHRADEASIEFLDFLAPQVGPATLWVVATVLPQANLSGARRALLERLERDGHAERVVVRPFTPNEVAEFVRVVHPGHTFENDEITRWHTQTAGNPLFLEQILRADHGGVVDPRRPPETAERLLAELSHDEQRVVGVASVVGREIEFPLLLKASGEEEERLTEITDALVRRGLLRERPGERLEFVRDDFRAEVYQSLTDTRRRLLHRKVGEAIESAAPANVGTMYALARHFYLGRVDDKAAGYNRLAADFAIRTYSPSVAVEHLEHALEAHRRASPHDAAGELEIVLPFAVQLDRLGELHRAEKLLTAVVDAKKPGSAVPASQRALASIYLARSLVNQGRLDDAEKLLVAVDEGDAEAVPAMARIAVARLRGEIEYYRGHYRPSLAFHDRALELARTLNDPREIALEEVRRANVLGMIPDRVQEAIATYRAATEKLVAMGDKAEAAYAELFLGVVMSQHGQTTEGLKVLALAAEHAEAAHDPRRLGWALFNTADLTRETGDLEGAEKANQRSRAILESVGDRFGLCQTYIIAGKILLARGDLARAEIELLEAYRLVRELNAGADELEVLLRLAEVAHASGDLPAARRRREELGRRDLVRLRPDLAEEYRQLTERLA
ncbi:MAG: AAA family ATPase [Thermoplasmata archaeon]|nr:AAA family ATPase [Thermoplasmata archaeon]